MVSFLSVIADFTVLITGYRHSEFFPACIIESAVAGYFVPRPRRIAGITIRGGSGPAIGRCLRSYSIILKCSIQIERADLGVSMISISFRCCGFLINGSGCCFGNILS